MKKIFIISTVVVLITYFMQIYTNKIPLNENTIRLINLKFDNKSIKRNSNTSTNNFPEMVYVKGGKFEMGREYVYNSPSRGDEYPVHTVKISSFYMSKYEITFNQYDTFCDATNREKPDDSDWGRGNRPVINVSWYDAKAYCLWLYEKTGDFYDLPTEAQWEYAAGGGSLHTDYSGSSYKVNIHEKGDIYEYAWYDDNSGDKTHPVGEKKPNKFGLYDMTGNVAEFTRDCYTPNYIGSPKKDPVNSSDKCEDIVVRGGGYDDSIYGFCLNTSRRICGKDSEYWLPKFQNTGFRVVYYK